MLRVLHGMRWQGLPLLSRRTFSGLRSRCTMPLECRYDTALTISAVNSRATSSLNNPCAEQSRRSKQRM